jgi:hypothetical protein
MIGKENYFVRKDGLLMPTKKDQARWTCDISCSRTSRDGRAVGLSGRSMPLRHAESMTGLRRGACINNEICKRPHPKRDGIRAALANNRESAGRGQGANAPLPKVRDPLRFLNELAVPGKAASLSGIDLMRGEGSFAVRIKKPGTVSRPGAITEFAFPKYTNSPIRSREFCAPRARIETSSFPQQVSGTSSALRGRVD